MVNILGGIMKIITFSDIHKQMGNVSGMCFQKGWQAKIGPFVVMLLLHQVACQHLHFLS